MLKQFLVAFTAVTTFYVLFAPIRAPIALIFALGAGVACLYIQRRHTSQNHFEEMSSRIYGVDHGILNIDLPLQTMWMNMGYWKDTQSFPKACESLLSRVLDTAALRWTNGMLLTDIGYGCGDQTLHIVKSMQGAGLIGFRYIGITLDSTQYQLGTERIFSRTSPLNEDAKSATRLFCADAASPKEWNDDIRTAIEENRSLLGTPEKRENWILALDTLYHFLPSRERIFRYAARDLDASIMAFDLLLAEDISLADKFLLRCASRLLSAPFSNFMTRRNYTKQLVEAGFQYESITISDITPDVFQGLSDFISRQDGALRQIGVTSFARFRWAGRLFRWFATGKVVRACIVITQKQSDSPACPSPWQSAEP